MQSIFRKLHFILLICVVFTTPFSASLPFTHAQLNNLFLILLAINAIALCIVSGTEKNQMHFSMVLLFLGVYLIPLVGLLNTDNFNLAFSDLFEKKIGILILPLILYYTPRLDRKESRLILLSFVISCVLTVAYCILIASYRFFILKTGTFVTYHDFSQLAGMHAVYLSMHLCFSLIILYYLFSEEVMKNRVQTIMILFLLMVLATGIFLCAGRIHIVLLIIGSLIYFLLRFQRSNSLWLSLSKAAGIGLLITSVAFLFPQNRERFKQAINYRNQYSLGGKWGEQQMRPLMWDCAVELITRAPLLGHGTGDSQEELSNCYRDNKYWSLLLWEDSGIRFNAHNQYLQITIGQGVLGLIIFVVSLVISLAFAKRNGKTLYLLWLILFMASCITESLLERQNGCIFFAFFNSFLFFYDSPERKIGVTAPTIDTSTKMSSRL